MDCLLGHDAENGKESAVKITHEFIYEGLKGSAASAGHIDLSAVADCLKVNLISWELSKNITSKVCARHGVVHLVINQQFERNTPIFRFIAAHAIGHIALGHLTSDSELTDEMCNYRMPGALEAEQAATRWGIELLAPQHLARLIIKKEPNPQRALVNQFMISAQVANYLINQENRKIHSKAGS